MNKTVFRMVYHYRITLADPGMGGPCGRPLLLTKNKGW